MNKRFVIGALLLAVGCGEGATSSGNGGSGGSTAGSGGPAGAGGGTAGSAAGATGNGGSGGSTAGSSGGGAAGTGPAGAGGTGPAGAGGTGPAGTGGSAVAGAGGTGGGAAGRGGAGGGIAGAAGGTAGRGGAGGGTAGAAGGTAGRGGGAGSTTLTNQSVYERNKNPSRDGHFIQPSLSRTAAAGMVPTPGFTATFTGSMWASPLYMENGVGGTGTFFAVTTGNNVFALDETTGAMKWMHSIGSSPQDSGAGCGSIHPIGILSTPVIDPTSRTIYVAGAIGAATITRHEVHALNIEDGASKTGWPVDVSNMSSGSFTFTPPSANQRSALSLVNGILYVGYGGHVGDCGPYHGWVIGINAANPTQRGGWVTGGQGEAIWAAGGMASDGNGVIAVTSNRNGGGSSSHLDSEAVVRVTGMGTRADSYWPANWATMDSQDADFGANSPVVITVPGATPTNLVAAVTKDGYFYLLDAANFGGMDGHRTKYKLTSTTAAMQIRTAPAAYRTATGTYVTLTIDSGSPNCPGGAGTGKNVVGVRITAANPPTAAIAWCASQSGGESTAPIVTTTDGQSEAIVWYMSGNQLRGVNGDTGAAVYSGTSTCGGTTRRWSSPIAVKNRIITGADGRLCSWSLP